MKDFWKYILAFFVGMAPLVAISYVIFCRWLGHDVEVVAPKFGAFAALIAAIYWSLYRIRGISVYQKRVRYITYILFAAGLIVSGLYIWWAHPRSGVHWLSELAILITTGLLIAGTLWLFYRNATRGKLGMRPDDVEEK